jgi:hypothetical protein
MASSNMFCAQNILHPPKNAPMPLQRAQSHAEPRTPLVLATPPPTERPVEATTCSNSAHSAYCLYNASIV